MNYTLIYLPGYAPGTNPPQEQLNNPARFGGYRISLTIPDPDVKNLDAAIASLKERYPQHYHLRNGSML